jgi:hypothetical protein
VSGRCPETRGPAAQAAPVGRGDPDPWRATHHDAEAADETPVGRAAIRFILVTGLHPTGLAMVRALLLTGFRIGEARGRRGGWVDHGARAGEKRGLKENLHVSAILTERFEQSDWHGHHVRLLFRIKGPIGRRQRTPMADRFGPDRMTTGPVLTE